MDWNSLGKENLAAARLLMKSQLYRACIGRAYYAAYCAVTGEILAAFPGRTFRQGRRNPPHERVAHLIQTELHPGRRSKSTREKLAREFEVLRNFRESADYRPSVALDEYEATQCLQKARGLLRRLGLD